MREAGRIADSTQSCRERALARGRRGKVMAKRRKTSGVTSRLNRDVSSVVVFALDQAAEERLKRRGPRAATSAATSPSRSRQRARSRRGHLGRTNRPRTQSSASRRSRPRREGSHDPLAHDRDRNLDPPRPHPPPRHERTRDANVERDERKQRNAPERAAERRHAGRRPGHRAHAPIRVHASAAGAPLIGDRDYGGPTRLVLPSGRILAPARIALHAARVIVPGAHGIVEARAPIPAELTEIWSALGGDASAWERALASETPSLDENRGA